MGQFWGKKGAMVLLVNDVQTVINMDWLISGVNRSGFPSGQVEATITIYFVSLIIINRKERHYLYLQKKILKP